MVASSGLFPAVKYSRNAVASRVADETTSLSDGRFRRILVVNVNNPVLEAAERNRLLQDAQEQIRINASFVRLIDLISLRLESAHEAHILSQS